MGRYVKTGAKVKTGCRTCKIRKVKCDEGFPECNRCITTGRSCDGYGIWGGGSTVRSHGSSPEGSRSEKSVSSSPTPAASLPTLAVTVAEKDHLEWFKGRTSVKLPGIFVSRFWDTLVFQASASDPAVLHAVLALSAVHKSELVYGNRLGSHTSSPSQQEHFMLQQYNKAIIHLRPQEQRSARDKASARVALVACVVFVCLELLRGHYQTAQAHLRCGISLLNAIRSRPIEANKVSLKAPSDSSDDWIVAVLSTLQTQTILLNPVMQSGHLIGCTPDAELPVSEFRSMNQAKLHLDRLLNKAHALVQQHLQQGTCGLTDCLSNLRSHKCQLQKDLASWLRLYNKSSATFKLQMGLRYQVANNLLSNYSTMATIMIETCDNSSSEATFDSHTGAFLSILKNSISLWTIIFTTLIKQTLLPLWPQGRFHGETDAIIDMGWIPPLYYVALNCRVHRIRLQAIRLLELSQHREGIWVAATAAAVGRLVMALEEGDFYRDMSLNNDFALDSMPEERDILLPLLPEQRRIHDVQVEVPNDPAGKVVVRCKRRDENGAWSALERRV